MPAFPQEPRTGAASPEPGHSPGQNWDGPDSRLPQSKERVSQAQGALQRRPLQQCQRLGLPRPARPAWPGSQAPPLPHPTLPPPHPTPAFGEIGTTGYGGGLHLGGYLVSLRPSNYPQPLGLLMAIHACARYVLFSLWINWFYYFVIIDTEIFFVSTGFAFTERHNWNNLCFHLKLVFCGFSKVLPLFALPSIPSTVGAR